MENKIAIGCLVQWYEIELVEEYLQSVKNAVDVIDDKKNVVVDLYFNCSQRLEKIDEKQITISDVKKKYNDILEKLFDDVTVNFSLLYNEKFIVASNPGWDVFPALTPVKVSKSVLCATKRFLISI